MGETCRGTLELFPREVGLIHIAFLIGDNPYRSTLHFTHKFKEALIEEGAHVECYDLSKGEFYKVLQNPPDLTCSFSDITVGDGMPLGDQWQIPHLSLLIDPAIYYLHQLKGTYSLVTCVDEKECEWIEKIPFPRVCFLPHGVEKDLVDNKEERIYDIAFFGTCTDYEQVRRNWKERFSWHTIKQLEEAAERVLSLENVSLFQALIEAGCDENLPMLHHELDLYISGKDRIELLRALKHHPLHIWGDGPWEKHLPSAHIYPSQPFDQVLPLLQKTRLLLNSSPRFKQGSHERIFYGLTSGALVLTGENPYINRHFTNDHLLTYRHGHWEECVDCVNTILSDESLRATIAKQGREQVLSGHTWNHRARTLLDFLIRAEKM